MRSPFALEKPKVHMKAASRGRLFRIQVASEEKQPKSAREKAAVRANRKNRIVKYIHRSIQSLLATI